jgi:hypothetical protein
MADHPHRWTAVVGLAAITSALLLVGLLSVPSRAYAAEAPVNLGTAGTYSVLAGSTVTNTGATTTLSGDIGVSPGTAITGFPPGTVYGLKHAADAAAVQAQADLTTAYNYAAGRTPTATVPTDLGGTTRVPGVYNSGSGTFGITGTVTLDGQGDPNAVFIFKMASTLITAASSNVILTNGTQASNVFWQVGSSATLGGGSTVRGTILALTSITVTTGAAIYGRALARNGAVTLDTNTLTEVSGGTLSITVPGSVDLGSKTASASSQTISGQLGAVTVTDTGEGTTGRGWTVTAVATAVTGPQTISLSAVGSSSYDAPSALVTGTGTATVTHSNLSHLSPAGTVQTATGATGAYTATWDPTISVTIPAGARAGKYSTTITHSLL